LSLLVSSDKFLIEVGIAVFDNAGEFIPVELVITRGKEMRKVGIDFFKSTRESTDGHPFRFAKVMNFHGHTQPGKV